jgi:hypothetical protein
MTARLFGDVGDWDCPGNASSTFRRKPPKGVQMRTRTEAVEAAIAGARLAPADEPLLALARTLAAQMDAAGDRGPGHGWRGRT